MPRAKTTPDTQHARKRATKFFRRLLDEAHHLPRAKLLAKAPAALAACYALFSLMDGPDAQEAAMMLTMLATVRQLFEAEVERARAKTKPN